MDREQFDALARQVSTRHSRRAALATVLGALLLRQEAGLVAAKRKRHGRRQSHRPGKGKDNRKGKRKGGGKVGTQDCPDGTVSCYTVDENGLCQTLVHQFPPIGHCYHFFTGCCPCAHRDQAYWTDQCNTLAVCNGQCRAVDHAGVFACFTCPGDVL